MASAVLDYHELSKHRLERYAPGPGHLDWATQPDPFRTYAGCERVELPLVADALAARFNDLRVGRLPPAAPLDGDAIAALLELSLGLSAWKSHRGASWALRCNPSSGNLHPTEGYVVCDAMPGLDAGVHHYVSRDHALERRARLAVAPHFAAGVVVGLSSIYWREAWKYGARAFRYCAHDCGHAIAAVAYAAAALGWRTRCLAAPGDADVARLLGLDRDADFAGAEREAPDCLLWVGTGGPPTADALARAVGGAQWSGAANALSPAHVEWREIDRVHAATLRPRTPLAPRFAPRGAPLQRTPALDLSAATITRQRRSAVDFDGVTAIDAEAFYAMLDPLVPRAGVPPWDAWPHAPRVHLALFVHRVTGLAPGLYVFVRAPEAAERLRRATRSDWLWRKRGPNALDLFLLIEHDLRDAARTVSCHQDIAADACFALGMLADFAPLERGPGATASCTGSAGWSARRSTSRPRRPASARPGSAVSSTTPCIASSACRLAAGARRHGRASTTSPPAAQWTMRGSGRCRPIVRRALARHPGEQVGERRERPEHGDEPRQAVEVQEVPLRPGRERVSEVGVSGARFTTAVAAISASPATAIAECRGSAASSAPAPMPTTSPVAAPGVSQTSASPGENSTPNAPARATHANASTPIASSRAGRPGLASTATNSMIATAFRPAAAASTRTKVSGAYSSAAAAAKKPRRSPLPRASVSG